MHYLEDFVDSLEYLPQVIRDKCTQLRELDLTVQNASSRVDKQAKEFFAVAGNMAPEEKDKTFKKIKENYMRSLEVADEKVRLAEQMSDTVKFQLRAIDEELLKYQAELEVDHPGITPILQKHSLLLDEPELGSRKSRRSRNSSNKKKSQKVKKRATLSQAVSTVTASASATATATSSSSASATVTSATAAKDGFLVPPAIPSSTVIAAAASQAIAATKKMQQGRRTASLKASYEAIDVGMHDLGLGRKVVAGTAKEASRKRQRRKSGGVAGMQLVPEATEEYAPESTGELVPGINEPTYCSCNQVSYGNMVACDNKDCKIEWFHYSCVGIQTPPEGKWYCPRCSVAMDSAN